MSEKGRKQGECLASRQVYQGRSFRFDIDRVRLPNGVEMDFEMVHHPGAAAIVPVLPDRNVLMIRQYRYATGGWLLEVPAGKLDVEDEPPLETAKRELAEEIGKAAADWREVASFYTSPGFTNEQVTVYAATGLSEAQAESDEEERIEIVAWPLERLDEAIADCHDSKSLIGLLWLARERDRAR